MTMYNVLMTFSDDILFRIVIAILAAFGFWVCKHIHNHKKPESTPLVCPINFDCHGVVHSDYSKFLHIPLEILGMIYYALVFVGYLVLVFMPEILPLSVVLTLILVSIGAFLFSLYLIGVQIFVLKKGCFWCFISAFISITIFILTIISYDIGAIIQTLTS